VVHQDTDEVNAHGKIHATRSRVKDAVESSSFCKLLGLLDCPCKACGFADGIRSFAWRSCLAVEIARPAINGVSLVELCRAHFWSEVQRISN
jgi:hypothetical protein